MADSHLWETAIHEAGHAVVGYRGSLYSHTLTIEPDEEKGILGACRSEDVWGGGGNAHEVILSYLAGREATRILCGTDPPGSESDEEQAAWSHRAHLSDRSMDELRAEAREGVERDTEAICAVATALCEDSPTLRPDDWEHIIDAIDENKDWRTELAEYRRRRPPGCV